MISMTGYGQARGKTAAIELEVSIRTVNGRFFEVRTHLPREYYSLESEIKKKLAAKLQRGTVDIYINRRMGDASDQMNVKVNSKLAQKWQKELTSTAKKLKIGGELTLDMMARQPEIVQFEATSQLGTGEKKLLLSTLDKALEACSKERVREGKSLQADMKKNITEMEKFATQAGKLRERVGKELREKLELRWQNLNFPGEIDEQRLAQEIVLQVDKTDINEEVTRLQEHLKAMKNLLGANTGVKGKKLDFFCQELLRETNTIGSKSQIAGLTQMVVDAKGIIERIREQVQNVE